MAQQGQVKNRGRTNGAVDVCRIPWLSVSPIYSAEHARKRDEHEINARAKKEKDEREIDRNRDAS